VPPPLVAIGLAAAYNLIVASGCLKISFSRLTSFGVGTTAAWISNSDIVTAESGCLTIISIHIKNAITPARFPWVRYI